MSALDERVIPWSLWAAGVAAVWWMSDPVGAAVAALTFGLAVLAALNIGATRGRDEERASRRRRS